MRANASYLIMRIELGGVARRVNPGEGDTPLLGFFQALFSWPDPPLFSGVFPSKTE